MGQRGPTDRHGGVSPRTMGCACTSGLLREAWSRGTSVAAGREPCGPVGLGVPSSGLQGGLTCALSCLHQPLAQDIPQPGLHSEWPLFAHQGHHQVGSRQVPLGQKEVEELGGGHVAGHLHELRGRMAAASGCRVGGMLGMGALGMGVLGTWALGGTGTRDMGVLVPGGWGAAPTRGEADTLLRAGRQ